MSRRERIGLATGANELTVEESILLQQAEETYEEWMTLVKQADQAGRRFTRLQSEFHQTLQLRLAQLTAQPSEA